MKPGGRWNVTGSYPPRISHPDDTVTCGARRPIQCGGPIKRNGPAAATLILRARRQIIHRRAFWPTRRSPKTQPSGPCLVNTEALLGLQDGLMERDVFRENSLEHNGPGNPRSRFARGRPFTATIVAGPDGGCHKFHYTHCRETGSLKMTLRFAPP